MSGHCNECGNTQCVCAANDPAWRLFEKRGEIARLEARVAELEAANAYNESAGRENQKTIAELERERDEWKASATTLKNLAGLVTSTLEARVAELERAMESVHVSLLMAADKTCDQPAWLDHATSTAKAVLPNNKKGGTE